MARYYDRAGQPISVERYLQLAGDEAYRRVGFEQHHSMSVSTVWLGVNHHWRDDAPPLIFQTMVFGGEHDQEQVRYSTEAAARDGHAELVRLVFGQRTDPRRPETDVLDAIEELVNEQLAVGPVDDYNEDRYPRCERCECPWHGQQCMCGCPGEHDGKVYTDQVVGVRYHDNAAGGDYTFTDVEEMRQQIGAYRYTEYFAPRDDQACSTHGIRRCTICSIVPGPAAPTPFENFQIAIGAILDAYRTLLGLDDDWTLGLDDD